MSEIHACLLSDQLLPNLIPVLMERPVRVYLVATDEMTARGRDARMRRLLRRENIEVRIRPRAPSTGIDAIRRAALKLAREIKSAEAHRTIALNATGGTKLLSMGFVEVFRDQLEGHPLRIIYTDTEHRVIETLVPREHPATPMEGVLQVRSYLAAQGMVLGSAASDDDRWRSTVKARMDVSKYLAIHCEVLGPFLGVVNRVVHGAGGISGALTPNGTALDRPEQRLDRRPWGLWRQALTRIADAGLVRWDGDRELRFDSVDTARYLGGHWLEEYAWLVTEAAGLQDIHCSAAGRWESQSGPAAPTNEFDLLAVHDNRLLLIECKTGRLDAGEQAIAARLESLDRNAGGLFGSSLLVSARELPATMKSRCRHLGIRFLERGAVKDLADCVSHWRDTGSLPIS